MLFIRIGLYFVNPTYKDELYSLSNISQLQLHILVSPNNFNRFVVKHSVNVPHHLSSVQWGHFSKAFEDNGDSE
jgi:hypothetical protein